MSILRVIFKKKVSRSIGGDIVLVVFLSLIGILMILPFVYTISTSLKPANELDGGVEYNLDGWIRPGMGQCARRTRA